jgi:hypothetical protein
VGCGDAAGAVVTRWGVAFGVAGLMSLYLHWLYAVQGVAYDGGRGVMGAVVVVGGGCDV